MFYRRDDVYVIAASKHNYDIQHLMIICTYTTHTHTQDLRGGGGLNVGLKMS